MSKKKAEVDTEAKPAEKPRPSPPVLIKAAPHEVIVPMVDPATVLELENKRLTERVAVLEAELRQIQKTAIIDFTRLHNVLSGI